VAYFFDELLEAITEGRKLILNFQGRLFDNHVSPHYPKIDSQQVGQNCPSCWLREPAYEERNRGAPGMYAPARCPRLVALVRKGEEFQIRISSGSSPIYVIEVNSWVKSVTFD
jgi:hypothetical protein